VLPVARLSDDVVEAKTNSGVVVAPETRRSGTRAARQSL